MRAGARLSRPTGETMTRVAQTTFAQGISSLTNFLAGALALHTAGGDLAAFGRFSIAYQICQVVISVTQSSLGASVAVHGVQPGPASRDFHASSALAAVTVGFSLAVLVGTAALVVGGDYQTPLLICAAGCPAIAAQYLLRYTYFAQARPRAAIVVDAIWLGVLLTAAILDAVGVLDMSVNRYLAVWLVGGFVSATPLLRLARRARQVRFGPFWSRAGRQSLQLGTEGLLGRSTYVISLVTADMIVGAEGSGILAAAVLLFSPLSVAHSTADAVAIPSLVREGGVHLPARRVGLFIFAAIAACTVGWALVLLGLSRTPWAIDAFSLDDNGITISIFLATMSRFLSMCLWRGAAILLRVADEAAVTLAVRVKAAVLEWLLPIAGFAIGGISGGIHALAIAGWGGALIAWQQYSRLRRVHQAGATAETCL